MPEGRKMGIGFSLLDPCDGCGARGQTAWINGSAGVFGTKHLERPLVVPPANYPDKPDRLVDLSIYLCEDCLKVALSRTGPSKRQRRAAG